ncbi:TlpA family protein disulfide reductase [Brumimicrobium aurantiacum]|uniref:TlpA family protein disulfide reductase n=1 Tax=Brumimicrobium aurantiacum TaxID=1737063 RepID=A0A3E1F2J9_9FLAO|nr:TlpA disulfide reductase family protein [Brumimicrobium aurantiacum]RFC55937.1 TlpA family protein disulfide reductase [Brumimicrobium aurantiacum]
MKNLSLLISTVFLMFTANSFAQGNDKGLLEKSIPEVQLKNTVGDVINTAKLHNDGKPMIISFWATWCTPCKKELNTIHDLYIDWQDETGVRLVAVSIDDNKTASRVVPYVDSKSWEYEILLDPNGDFKRAMGVNNVPHTFLIDGNGKIVYSHNNYAPGDEYELYDHVLELTEEK